MAWILIKAGCSALAIGLTFHDVVGTVVSVDGPSMQPTLNPTTTSSKSVDFVYLNKWSIRQKHKVGRGDVVALE